MIACERDEGWHAMFHIIWDGSCRIFVLLRAKKYTSAKCIKVKAHKGERLFQNDIENHMYEVNSNQFIYEKRHMEQHFI